MIIVPVIVAILVGVVAYYIDENDLTEDGVFKSDAEKEKGSKSN